MKDRQLFNFLNVVFKNQVTKEFKEYTHFSPQMVINKNL